MNDKYKKNSVDSYKSYTLNFDGSTAISTEDLKSWKSACAYLIKQDEKKILSGSNYLGGTKSNGTEFLGLIYGLVTCFYIGVRKVQVYGDSQVIIFNFFTMTNIKM